jgi:hypothetical protein
MRTLLVLIMSISLIGCPKYHRIEFTNEIYLLPKPGFVWQIQNDLYFKVDNVAHKIPEGFKTDLASVPRLLWPLFSPVQYEIILPSTIHDFFYKNNFGYTRKEIDSIFYWALIDNGISKFKAYVFFVGVRMFGWNYFNKGSNAD